MVRHMGIERAGAQLFLQARGFQRVRRKVTGVNRYYYQFYFTLGGVKAQSASYVRLCG